MNNNSRSNIFCKISNHCKIRTSNEDLSLHHQFIYCDYACNIGNVEIEECKSLCPFIGLQWNLMTIISDLFQVCRFKNEERVLSKNILCTWRWSRKSKISSNLFILIADFIIHSYLEARLYWLGQHNVGIER